MDESFQRRYFGQQCFAEEEWRAEEIMLGYSQHETKLEDRGKTLTFVYERSTQNVFKLQLGFSRWKRMISGLEGDGISS